MLARRSCVYNAGLKFDVAREILTVIMMSNDENVCLCKTHSSLSLVLFLAIALAWRLTTVSLDHASQLLYLQNKIKLL